MVLGSQHLDNSSASGNRASTILRVIKPSFFRRGKSIRCFEKGVLMFPAAARHFSALLARVSLAVRVHKPVARAHAPFIPLFIPIS